MARLIRCGEALYQRAAALAEERGVSLGAALELMTSTSAIQPKAQQQFNIEQPQRIGITTRPNWTTPSHSTPPTRGAGVTNLTIRR
jgi:hypothetical protein